MAVAMASCSLGLSLNTSNSSLKRPLANPLSIGALVEGSPVFVSKSISIVQKGRWPSSLASIIAQASSATAVEDGKPDETDVTPVPKVIIDQDSDPDATVVEITFGDRLGALLDTMSALKNLGLNVVKANVFLDSSGRHNKFAITRADTGRKVDDPELLEAIRLTIINNMIQYHPESSSQLAMGTAFGIVPPPQQVDVDIATRIRVHEDGPNRSLLTVESADRPGLLVDLVKIITDINIAVESGEFDTVGLLAKAKFHVSYRGKPIIKPLQQVLANSLRYFLRRPATEEAWLEKHSGRDMATVFARGAQTMNTMFFKPAGRKAFHKKSTSADMIRETRKFEGDEMKNKSHMGMGSSGNDGNVSWVPHERTGIYYPKGQEKVMDEISPAAGRDVGVNWFT